MGLFDLFGKRSEEKVKNSEFKEAKRRYDEVMKSEFYMQIFQIADAKEEGIIVSGVVEEGEVSLGEEVYLKKKNGQKKLVKVENIEMAGSPVGVARETELVEIYLKNVTRAEIEQGDALIK